MKFVGLNSLSALIDNIKDKYAEVTHKHAISDITNLQETIENILQPSNHLISQVENLNNIVNNLIPKIGDIYITLSEENPSTRFGGEWELFSQGRTLVCIDTSQDEFNTIGKTGGSKFLQSHSHEFSTTTSSDGAHSHTMGYVVENLGKNANTATNRIDSSGDNTTTTGESGEHTHSVSGVTTFVGSGNSENLQPYVVCYMYKRIA